MEHSKVLPIMRSLCVGPRMHHCLSDSRSDALPRGAEENDDFACLDLKLATVGGAKTVVISA